MGRAATIGLLGSVHARGRNRDIATMAARSAVRTVDAGPAVTSVHAMGTHVCFETPNALIRWEGDDVGYLLIRHSHWVDARQVRDAIPAFLDAVREHHVTRCLSDSRQRRVIEPEAQEAFISAIGPAAALGLQRLAIVLPRSVVIQTTLIPLVPRYREHLEADFFSTMDEAIAWLQEGAVEPLPGPADRAGSRRGSA